MISVWWGYVSYDKRHINWLTRGHHRDGVESNVYNCGLQVLGLVAACVLMRTRRTAENFIYRDLADTEGMHI